MEPLYKHWIYQVYDRTGVYLGVLKDVRSIFELAWDINTIGPSSITIEVAKSGDTAYLPVKYITTEDGKIITTEDGRYITTDGEGPNYGVSGSKVRNGNIVKIIEVSRHHPEGLVVFQGKIKRWKTRFGGGEEIMSLIVYPLSLDMNNHIVKSGAVQHSSYTSSNTTYAVYGEHATSGRRLAYQLPTQSRGMDNISGFTLRMAAQNASVPATVSVRVFNNYSSSPPPSGESANLNKMNTLSNAVDQAVATAVVSGTTQQEYTFTFPTPISLNTSGVYTVEIESTGVSGQGVNVSYTTVNTDNAGLVVFWNGSIWDVNANSLGELYYKMQYIPPFTKATITNFDPGLIERTVMDNYIGEGGVVTYSVSDVTSTGQSVPEYTFSLSLVSEGHKVMLAFAPDGFYYIVDVGANTFTFTSINTDGDFTLIYRRDFIEGEFSASIEDIKNAIYFSGGKDGGSTNLYRYNDDEISIADFGIEIDRLTDVNITDNASADTYSLSYIDKNNDENYAAYLDIFDATTDITQYTPGKTVRAANTGNPIVDELILPIVRVERGYDKARLYLGVLPPRQTNLLTDTQSKLLALQTVDNPNSPS